MCIFALNPKEQMLHYRFPGHAIVSKNGHFNKLQDTDIKGFILSHFNNQEQYFFKESTDSREIRIIQDQPYTISKTEYLAQAKEVIAILQGSAMKKLVYSRVKAETISVSGKVLFDRLETAYPNAFVYYFQDPVLGEWIGATPETLIKGMNNSFTSMSLAGTKKANDVSPWGEKEMEEQNFVSQFIHETLLNHEVQEVAFDGPKTVQAGPLNHLRTDFKWKSTINTAWKIAQNLHPTPAVSGTPVQASTEWILSNEKHERLFYAGMIGELQADELNVYVNLRCGQIIGDQLYLYLGGGFTAESDPEKEWEETENKSKTLLDLL
jgi:isochorismate synthase